MNCKLSLTKNMFNQLTYKQKNILLLVSGCLFTVIMYQLSIKETLEKKEACETALVQAQLLANAPNSIASLNGQLAAMRKKVGYAHTDSMDTQQLVLEKVTAYCEDQRVELKKFPKPLLENAQNYQVETIQFVVEGGFIPLLKLIYEFEQTDHLGKVVSVDFNVKKELRSRKERLYATFFIQNIKKS